MQRLTKKEHNDGTGLLWDEFEQKGILDAQM